MVFLPLTFEPQTGLLTASPAFHTASVGEIWDALVAAFPASARRPSIWAAYVDHRRSLRALDDGDEQEQWLDGSFACRKENPGDLDLVTFIAMPAYVALSPAARQQFDALFCGRSTRPDGLLDSYLEIVEHDASGNETALTTQARDYWRKQFGHERDGTPKGIIRTKVGDRHA